MSYLVQKYNFFSIETEKISVISALSQLTLCRPSFHLKSGHIWIKDVHCAETYKTTISWFWQFSFFEIWSILYSKCFENWPKYHQKCPIFLPTRCAMFWNICKINFLIFAIFIFWYVVDFVPKILSELVTLHLRLRLLANLIQKR